MRVVIHYLAQVKQAAGVASESVDLDPGATVQHLVRRLVERHGAPFQRLLLDGAGELHPSILLFVGETQVSWATPHQLRDNDDISILAPMAGG